MDCFESGRGIDMNRFDDLGLPNEVVSLRYKQMSMGSSLYSTR